MKSLNSGPKKKMKRIPRKTGKGPPRRQCSTRSEGWTGKDLNWQRSEGSGRDFFKRIELIAKSKHFEGRVKERQFEVELLVST